MPEGIIKKIVRASLSVPGPQSAYEKGAATEGYGIIRALDGREVLFVHSAVEGNRFHDLHEGQSVEFVVEEGPISLARAVVPIRQDIPITAG